MKANRLIVIVSNKQNDCYQVALTPFETDFVLNAITQFHEGKIKAMKPKLSMEIINKIQQ